MNSFKIVLQSAHEEVATNISPIWLLLPFLEINVSYEKILEALDDWHAILELEVGSNKKQRYVHKSFWFTKVSFFFNLVWTV